ALAHGPRRDPRAVRDVCSARYRRRGANDHGARNVAPRYPRRRVGHPEAGRRQRGRAQFVRRSAQGVSEMAQRITRRTLLKGGTAFAGAAAGALDLNPVVYAQGGAPPIRIGFLPALTGTAAPSGRDMLDGLTLYLDQHNSTIAGRSVQ